MRIQTPALISIASLLLSLPVAAQTFEIVQQPSKKSSTATKTEKKATPAATPAKPVKDATATKPKPVGVSSSASTRRSKSAVAAKSTKKSAAKDAKTVAETKSAESEATETAAAPAPKEEVVPPLPPFKSNLPGAVIVTGEDVSALRAQIQSALERDSSLSGSALTVNINDTMVELTGTVNNGKERTAAHRIAQSYSGNRRVQDRITVLGQPDTQTARTPATSAQTSTDAASDLPQADTGAAARKAKDAQKSNNVPAGNPLVPKADKNQPKTEENSTPPPIKAHN